MTITSVNASALPLQQAAQHPLARHFEVILIDLESDELFHATSLRSLGRVPDAAQRKEMLRILGSL